MRTILDKATRDALTHRIQMLNESHTAHWGKMNVHQMVKHCILWEEMALGKTLYKREFIGLLIGRLVMKSFFKADKPMDKNVPAGELKIKGSVTGNFAEDKKQWVSLIQEYTTLPPGYEMIHCFFGRLTREQVGHFAFKHTDHHLRQFGI